MTDSNPVKEAEASMANLLLDEVTGEKVSKTELKRRQKLREKEAKKKEKEAAAPPKPTKKASAEEEEANLTPNVGKTCADCPMSSATDPRLFFSNTSRFGASASTSCARPRIRTPTRTSSKSTPTCASSSRTMKALRRASRSPTFPSALPVASTPSVHQAPS